MTAADTFHFKNEQAPASGFMFAPVSAPVCIRKPDLVRSILALASVNKNLVNWSTVSGLSLRPDDLHALKDFLNWRIVSENITLAVAKKFSAYVDWAIVERNIVDFTRREALVAVRAARTDTHARDIIDLAKYRG